MSYAIRNTLIIAAFWALIMGGMAYFIYVKQEKSLDRLTRQQKQKTAQVEELYNMESEQTTLVEQYQHLKDISLGKLGTLASNESPGETFDYVLRELKKTRSSLILNLEFISHDSLNNYCRNAYELSGMGKFADVYELLWFLENGPIFYDIRSIKIERKKQDLEIQSVDADITFSIDVWGFDKNEGMDIVEVTRVQGEPKVLTELVANHIGQALDVKKVEKRPKIESTAPVKQAKAPPTIDPNPEGLPVVTADSEVLAITPRSVIVKNADGKTVKLSRGDRILGGKLNEIDLQSGRAVFSTISNGSPISLVLTAKN
jgi:hypothetical protein